MRSELRRRTRRARALWASGQVALKRLPRTARALRDAAADIGDGGPGRIEVDCVVFSKDRALQLDACLRSIERHAPYRGSITVICKATTREFRSAYESLGRSSSARFVTQGADFREDVMRAIDGAGAQIVFHTDDDVFFRTPSAAPVLTDAFAAFSLRLGRNATHCYTLDAPQAVPEAVQRGSIIVWDWTRAEHDFAYPISLDGHVLSTSLLRSLLSDARFSNPNELEEELHFRRHRAPRLMASFTESCVVSLPINIVTSTHQNLAGQNPDWTAEALNARFLDGYRIDLESMDFAQVRGAHQEIPLAFAESPGHVLEP